MFSHFPVQTVPTKKPAESFSTGFSFIVNSLQSYYKAEQVRDNSGAESCDCVGKDGLRDEFAIAEEVEEGGVG